VHKKLLPEVSKITLLLPVFLLFFSVANAQVDICVYAEWGIDAGVYSGIEENGIGVEPAPPYSRDWFQGPNGVGIIDETDTAARTTLLQAAGDPLYEVRQKFGVSSIVDGQIILDAVYARDNFGGTGHTDPTSFVSSAKNGQDPSTWPIGTSNVLGKNDIIDLGAFMFRNGSLTDNDLWFVGLYHMAEPGGTAYMDFEFYIQPISKNQAGTRFLSGGPNLGHTAFEFDGSGNITKIGDFIISISLLSSGPVAEIRLWVRTNDYNNLTPATFQWDGAFDGPFSGAPFGYARVKPLDALTEVFCGVTNTAGAMPAPPWGVKTTKNNVWRNTYPINSLSEVGLNLTALGLDQSNLFGDGSDPCFVPINSFIVKTRASASFTAALKDYAGPYSWARASFMAEAEATDLSCDNFQAEVYAFPERPDVEYNWSTVDGNIVEFNYNGDPWRILVDQPGTYDLEVELPTECVEGAASATVTYDPTEPFFDPPVITGVGPACGGNDGSISLTITGAIGPYTYTWEKDGQPFTVENDIPPGTHTLEDLEPGFYEVTVKGLFSCEVIVADLEIEGSDPPTVDGNITNLLCFGANTGSITLDVTDGLPPFTYQWSNGNQTQNIQNLTAGSYSVVVTDSNGCETAAGPFEVTQPTRITATIDSTNDPGNAGNGSATVNPSNGTPGYTYQWSKTGDPGFDETTQTINNLGYGQYTVRVTDSNGCFRDFTVFIYEAEICDDAIDNSGNGLIDCQDAVCVPSAPSAITPSDASPCVGEGVTYSVIEDPQVEYVWTVPGNASITSGQGTNEITVEWSNTNGGQICVRAKAFECLSPPVCINVTVDDTPAQPGDINVSNN